MSFTARVTVAPDIEGGFQPGTFADLLQTHVHLPGLDPAWTHTLVGVDVAADGNSAELTVLSAPIAPMSLDRSMRLVNGCPPANVRALDEAGTVLAEATHAAPMQVGQVVDIAGTHWRVTAEEWPGRHPETGVCEGGLDWQHITVTAAPPVPALSAAG